jgi:hypothetical protein
MKDTLGIVDGRMMGLESRRMLAVFAMCTGILRVVGRMMQRIVHGRNQSTADQQADGENGAQEARTQD